MTLASLWNSFFQTGPRRRLKKTYRLEFGLENRALLSSVSACEANADVTGPIAEHAPDSGDVDPNGAGIVDFSSLSWCGVIDTSLLIDGTVEQDTADELTPVICDGLILNNELFLDPVDPAIESSDEPVDGEVDPMVIRCFGVNPDAEDVVEDTDPPAVVEDPIDSTNPDVLTDQVDDPNVVFYSLGGGGRGTDENGNIPPNFRGGHQQSRHDRRQARKQEKASRKADRQANVQQHKSNRPARHAGRRHH